MGRPKGSKNKNPKNTSKIEGKKEVEEKVDGAVEAANKKFIGGLSGEMKELYAGFSKRHVLPLDDLRELAQQMKARYNIGLQTEIQEHEAFIQLAKEEKKEIEESGKLYGLKSTEGKKNTKLRKLRTIIYGRYYISSQLTTLSAELKNVFVEIERIEAGQPKGNVTIFNLLKDGGDKKLVDALEEEVFRPVREILDMDDEQAEPETIGPDEEDPNDN